MSATAKQIAQRFIGAAQKHPNERSEIFRKAAYTFMGLAQDPKNALAAGQLARIGLDFAGAATRERPTVIDDFTDLLRETEIAYNEVGDDPMDLIARRREVHDERTLRIPGHASIAPESFNRDATLGRSAVIKFAPSQEEIKEGILQSQNVAFWQGTKKEAQSMTVDISLGFLPPFPFPGEFTPLPPNVRPYAEVEYGSDGNRTKVKFDVSFGRRLTVVGNYIAVTVGVDPPRVGSTTAKLTAGASIGAFAAPSPAPLILTRYIENLGFLETSEFIPIPLKAVQLLPVQSDLAFDETATMFFFDYGGTLLLRWFLKNSHNIAMSPIPIAGDIAFVQITSSGANPTNFRLPFQLAM